MRTEEKPGATPAQTEQMVVQMIREQAAKEEEGHRRKWGRDHPIQIKDVKAEGSFPNTNIMLLVADEGQNKREWQNYDVWHEPSFKGPGGYYGPGRMAGDILMWARGG